MESLRHVELDGYTLQTWDTGTTDTDGKARLSYEFKDPSGNTLFAGDDFCCSPLNAIDSDDTLRSLLGFLTLKPGDTDADYFEKYTPEQMAFAQGDAEMLSLWSIEPEEGSPAEPFNNLDGFEGHTYEVIVGNIGSVYDGPSQTEAETKYATYVEQSKSGHGRAGGEPVTMMCDGEISQEHTPENDDDEEDEDWDDDEEEESDGVHNYDPL